MKFFLTNFKKQNNILKKKKNLLILQSTDTMINQNNNVGVFTNFFVKGGSSLKYKNVFSKVLKNLNFLLYFKYEFIKVNHQNMLWFVDNVVYKKYNYTYVFESTRALIKPPFIIKSILVPKKIKKKTKQKYVVKVVYKNEQKRTKNSLKQLQYYTNTFMDSTFAIRLYKATLFTFLD